MNECTSGQNVEPKASYSGQNVRLKNFTVCLIDCIKVSNRPVSWADFCPDLVTLLSVMTLCGYKCYNFVTILHWNSDNLLWNVTLVVKSTWYVISRWCSMRLKFYKELFSIQHIQYYKCLSININNVIYTKNWQAFSLKYLFYFKIKTRFLWTSVREKSTDWISDSVREL